MATPNIRLLMGAEAAIGNVSTVAGQLLFTTDTGKIYFDTNGEASGRKLLYKSVIDDVSTLSNLVGTKSVATQIQEALAGLGTGDTPAALITEIQAGDGIEVDTTTPATPVVSVKLAETDNLIQVDGTGALKVDANKVKDYTVTIEKATENLDSEIAAAYTIKQEATGLNTTINIPASMIVSSGTLETNPAGKPEGTYLVITLANADKDKLYINVTDLIQNVTSGSQATDDIVIAIDNKNAITATLSESIKESINKADSAIQPIDIQTAENAGTYVSGFAIEDGKVKVKTAALPEFVWGTF